jgi:hypothetical protein
MDRLVELLRQGADRLVELPNDARRFMTNPQAFTQLVTGKNPMPRETGFAAGAMTLPPTEMSVLDPNQAPYMQGYSQGEPFGIAATVAPFAAPAAIATAKALAPKAGMMAENYMVKQGFMPNIVPPSQTSQMSEFVPNVKAGEEMIVHHNVPADKLYSAEKLGGMPVPSLAISKINAPLEGFGEITLVGSKEMAIPSKTNPVFKSDAYTKRKPQILYQMDTKSEQNLKNLFGDLPASIPKGEFRLGNLLDDFGRASENDVVQAKFLQEKGILPNPNDFVDKWQFDDAVRRLRRDNQGEYDQWFAGFVDSLPEQGVNIKEKLFKGYTPSGNRKYAPADLENIVKEMKGGAGTEGFDYGVGNLRAIATPKFKKFDEIVNSRDRLITKADFEVVKDASNKAYDDLGTRLRSFNKNYNYSDALSEVAETGNINILDRMYPNIPPELKADVASYINGLKKMPSEYFEIKPQRAMNIGEFKGALVPDDLPAKARGILEKAGIKEIYTYANPQERKNLIKKFGKEMFVGIPAVPLALSNDEVQAKTRQQTLEEQFKKIE